MRIGWEAMTLDLLRREFAVKGENLSGKTMIIRRGFTSQEAAEDYPVKWFQKLRSGR